MDICVFCSKPLVSDTVTLGLKGTLNINKISEARQDCIKVDEGQEVHKVCRKNYTRPKNNFLKEAHASEPGIIEVDRITATNGDELQNICLFCAKPVNFTESRKRGIDVHQVKNENFETSIRKCIRDRNDKWANEVDQRIGTYNLLSLGAIYHQYCSSKFRTLKECTPSDSDKKIGRPQDQSRDAAFLKICEFMEGHEGEVFSLSDLSDRMNHECGPETYAYSSKYLKQRLLDYFGENLVISQMSGSKTLVLFRYSAAQIISDFYKENRKIDNKEEKQRIIQLAARLIRSDILSIQASKEEYPHPDDLSNIDKQIAFLPNLLSEFLTGVIKSKHREVKVASIGQALIQAARPRSIICPIQIGLGVQMHTHFASKYGIQTLNKLGFCSSYTEVLKFELCAAASTENMNINIQNNSNKVVKFVADNVDHDTRTLDGKNTFHGMGIIAAFTPANSNKKAVKRVAACIEDVRAIGSIQILQYEGNNTEKKLFFETICDLNTIDSGEKIDFLLNVTWRNEMLRPSWSGLMQTLNHGTHSGKSSITFLPLINLNPSDLTCIYSTLLYVADEAKKLGVKPVLTFDQPLFWKAQIIIANEPDGSPLMEIILLLGGFHTAMSFLGCIGHFMDELGLEETLETIYASNSVKHMLSGKAFSRAVRGHFIVDSALNTLITREIAPQVLNDNDWNDILDKVNVLYDELIAENIGIKELNLNPILDLAKEKMESVKQNLSNNSRTARLWLQYADMIQILRSFFRSERTGDWNLHLATLQKMLPYFAAAGHIHYAKCVYIYLQQMLKLKENHPDVHKIFSNGDFIIRRSDRYWGGIACDLTIEQTLMRPIKTNGGLTHGRGIDENQRLIWTNSMPDCIEIKNSMEQLTQLRYETSEQHKDCGASSVLFKFLKKRDHEDTQRVLDFLKDRNPFQLEDPALRNICNGMMADSKVNVDEAAKIGKKIISSMAGENVSAYTFKQANSVVKMSTKNVLVIDGDIVKIDPQLLFQRLILITKDMDDDQIQNVFKYELSQKPSALFDEFGFLRQSTNSMEDALWKYVGRNMDSATSLPDCDYVLEGHSLINKIPWQKNETFDAICLKYINYVAKYNSPTIVFHSNESNPSIRDEIHLRHTKGIPGRDIAFTGSMQLNCKKESFLSNRLNMQRFIDMLGKVLLENNCNVIFTSNNPAKTIAQTAVRLAATNEVVVIGEDTNVLVVLCHFFAKEDYNIWFKAAGKNAKNTKLWNIRKMDKILGEVAMKCLPFLHAIMGCGTTSDLYGLGKGIAIKKFLDMHAFRAVAEVFLYHQSKVSDIIDAGNKALCILYNGKTIQDLNILRYQRFQEKVSSKTTAVLVQSLPPTEAAAKYHSLRTYFQIQEWIGQNTLDPIQFGWELQGNMLRAKTTDLGPAPVELLSSIRCKCKGDCSTRRCNCKKNTLKCTTACGVCKGILCRNSKSDIIIDDDDDDDLSSEE